MTLRNPRQAVRFQAEAGSYGSKPDKVTALATVFTTIEPKMELVQAGSFIADQRVVRVEVEVTARSKGICHGLFKLFMGPVAQPVFDGTVDSAVAGVVETSILPVSAGEDGRAGYRKQIVIDNAVPGTTYNWDLRAGIVGYANTIAIPDPGEIMLGPDNETMYVLSAATLNRLYSVMAARHIHDALDVVLTGDDSAVVPYAFTGATNGAFTSDSALCYVVDWLGARVVILDTLTNRAIGTIRASGFGPVACAQKFHGDLLYVANFATGPSWSVKEINKTSNTIVGTHAFPDVTFECFTMALNPDNSRLACVMTKAATNSRLVVFNTATWAVVNDVDMGAVVLSKQIAWESNSILWVPQTENDLVRRFDSVAGTFSANPISVDSPYGVAVPSSLKTLYVTSNGSGDTFRYYNLPSSAGSVPVQYEGVASLGLCNEIVLSSDAYIYIAQFNQDRVWVYEGGELEIDTVSNGGEAFWGERAVVSVWGGH